MIDSRNLRQPRWDCIHFVDDIGSLRRAITSLAGTEMVIAEVDLGEARDKKEVLSAVGAALFFPEYFGANWDAFEECLRDMAWLPSPGYVLVVHGGDDLWKRHLALAGDLVSSWLFCAENWGKEGVPFHLVFSLSSDRSILCPTLA